MLTEKEKGKLKTKIRSNKHEIYVLSVEELDAIIKSHSEQKKLKNLGSWEKLRDKLNFVANYTASALDVTTLGMLVGDMGSVGAKVYIKKYGGKAHIILKGRPGLRTILTGTKYGIKNPKVIAMGLGRAGAINAAKSGGLLTVVLLTTYRVADYFLTDEATLTQLIGTLATDVVKVGIATGLSIGAAVLAGGLSIAVGPIVAVILVGVSVSWGLGVLDEKYGITDRVIAGLDELSDDANAFIENKKQKLVQIGDEVRDSLIDYAISSARRIVVRTMKNYLHKYVHQTPSIY